MRVCDQAILMHSQVTNSMAQTATCYIVTNHTSQENICPKSTGIDAYIGCSPRNDTLRAQFQNEHRCFTRDASWFTNQVFVCHYITNDQDALATEAVDKRAQT